MEKKNKILIFGILLVGIFLIYSVIADLGNVEDLENNNLEPSRISQTIPTTPAQRNNPQQSQQAPRVSSSTTPAQQVSNDEVATMIADTFISSDNLFDGTLMGNLGGLFNTKKPTYDENLESTIKTFRDQGVNVTDADIKKAKEMIEKRKSEWQDDSEGGNSDPVVDPQKPEDPEDPSKPQTITPTQQCQGDDTKDITFNSSKFNSSFEEEDETATKDFMKQWCAFQKLEGKDKNKAWESLSEGDRARIMQSVGKQYGIDISGIEKGTWDGNKLVLGKNTIDMDLEGYYSKENDMMKFEFRDKKDWEYNRKPIREIKATEDGVEISLGDEGKGQSKINIKGEGVEFDPKTMKVKSGGKEYSWNGQGDLKYDSTTGKMNLKFNKGEGDNDATNFPIIRMENGEEVSPFQERVEGVKVPSDVKKPTGQGYTLFGDGKYTVDQFNTVREIKEAEIQVDKTTGNVESIKDSFINKKELGGDLYARGEFGIGKRDKGNYFDLSGKTLTINADGSSRLHYVQNGDLDKLDVKGSGEVFIRNGDKVLNMKAGKLSYKVIPKELHEAGGKFKYKINEIVNQEDAKKPFKLIEDPKTKEITLMDTTGKPLNEQGTVDTPVDPNKPEDPNKPVDPSSNGESDPKIKAVADKYLKKSGNSMVVQSKTDVSIAGANSGAATAETFTIDGLDKIPEGLSKDEFMDYIIEKGELGFKLEIVSSLADKKTVIQGMNDQKVPGDIIALFEKNLPAAPKGSVIDFKLIGGKPQATLNGKPVTIGAAADDIPGYVKKVMTATPKPIVTYKGLGLIKVVSTPKYRDGVAIKYSPRDVLYEKYKTK